MRRRVWCLVCVAVTTAVVASGAPRAQAQDGDGSGGDPTAAAHVVVVGVGGLRWSDVDVATTPELADVTQDGSVGVLSVRSAPAVTCPSEGWLTLGAGTYAAATPVGQIDAAAGCEARPVPSPIPWPGTDAGWRVTSLPGTDALNRDLRFGAKVGWLSRRLGCVASVGDGAALAAASAEGVVAHHSPALPADFTTCPTTLVDAGALPEGDARPAALSGFDATVGRVRAALPPDTVLMVLGLSEVEATRPRLHVVAATGPGFDGGYLRSGSTRRVPYVQLVDVAPTIVSVLGLPVPDTVAGRPFVGGQLSGQRPADLAEAVSRLVDADRRAEQQRQVLPVVWIVLGSTLALLATALSWVLVRRHRGSTSPAALVEGLRLGALGMAAVPAATFLANVAPWWRTSTPVLAVIAAVVAAAGGMLALALAVGSAARRWAPGVRSAHAQVATIAVASVLVFFGDALSGARLQVDSLLGYNALHAGRFVGFGNIAFAVLSAGAVVAASLLAVGRERRAALLAVVAVAVPVLALDGAPQLGADFGGVLTLVPTFVVLALLVAGYGVTWRRLVGAQAVGALVVGAVAWLDYLRPEGQRSHFGRFVGTVLDGTAWATIERKALASWELLFIGPHTLAALVLTVVCVVVVFRSPVLDQACEADPVLRPMLRTTVALSLIGFATNDSGVAIPAVVALVAVPLTLVLCTSALPPPAFGGPEQPPPPRA